jgi:hypothetical protein
VPSLALGFIEKKNKMSPVKRILFFIVFSTFFWNLSIASPFAEITVIQHVCGEELGEIQVELIGNPDQYTYYWLHGPTDLYLTDLVAGIYTLVVIDFYGCIEEYPVEILEVNGCTVSHFLASTRIPCEIEIQIVVTDNDTGLPIDESSLIVEWDDGDPSGLKRVVNQQIGGIYCVTITSTGSGQCCSSYYCVPIIPDPDCDRYTHQDIIVNELYRNETGESQFIELLVRGNGNCGDSTDIRGYHIDDNNGYLIPGEGSIISTNAASVGINQGFLSFSYDSVWASVPNGSIILLYKEGIKGHGVPPDDPTDVNQDFVYVLPGDSDYLVGSSATWNPSASEWDYQGMLASPKWDYVEISPFADGAQVRHNDGVFSHGQSLGETNASTENNFPIWITPNFGQSCNCFFSLTDPLNKDHFVCPSVEDSLHTPGAPNTIENASFIDSLRNCSGAQSISVFSSQDSSEDEFVLNPENQQLHNLKENKIYAYPNPFRNKLMVDVNSEERGMIAFELMSLTGASVFNRQAEISRINQKFTLDIDIDFSPGVYFLKVTFPQGGTLFSKVVKVSR